VSGRVRVRVRVRDKTIVSGRVKWGKGGSLSNAKKYE
jgi:hypothetical protein